VTVTPPRVSSFNSDAAVETAATIPSMRTVCSALAEAGTV